MCSSVSACERLPQSATRSYCIFSLSSVLSNCAKAKAKAKAEASLLHFGVALLTGTRRDVTLLVLLRWTQAGLASVLGLRVAAGALAAADPPAAVPAALRPRAPRGPAAVQRVAGHPAEAKDLPCWTVDNAALRYDTPHGFKVLSFILAPSDVAVFHR